MYRTAAAVLVLAATFAGRPAGAQVLQAPFDTDYTIVDLGAVPSLPSPAGGLTFKAGDPDTILIGGAANSFSGQIFSIGVTRDAGQHITAFTNTATLVADAHGIGSGGIDGGLSYGPGGILFYTSYADNSLGQIKPGSTAPDRQDALTPLGIASSVGALAFVPAGFAGAGRMKLVQYNAPGNWYDVVLGAADANGTYPITSATLKATIGNGPEGIIYVAAGNPQITAESVIVSEYSGGSVSVYEIDGNGDPVAMTRRPFITGLSGAEGAVIDPLTGDFLFSTFGGGNRVIVIRGFIAPPSTTSTTTTTSTSTTSSTAIVATTTSTTTAAPTTTTTTPTGDCPQIPAGPTFESITCRLTALREETASEPALGNLAAKVLVPLDKAVERTASAREECASAGTKKAKTRLKQAVHALAQYSHRLRSRSAKKRVSPTLLEHFAASADAIGRDEKTLRTAVSCPQDA